MRYRFGDHVLDPDRRELHRGAELVAVEPRVFDLLLHLVINRDRVVTKDQLIETVWRGRIVSDSAIDSRMKAARHAIGDSGSAQHAIRTMPRKGVRFVADVTEDDASSLRPTTLVTSGAAESFALALPDKPSIAILPFANMSSDPEQEFIADGIAEDIITALSRYPSLFVIARNSSFTYKGQTVDLRRVGRELGVRYVLEGSLRKAGGRARITAQLIEADSGNHLWAERYDRELDDIFDVQDQIAETVAVAVAPAVADAERHRAVRKPPGSLDACTAYQRGLWHFGKFTDDDNALARTFFERAIDLDSNFAGGYVGLSFVKRLDANRDGDSDPEHIALSLARRAVQVDANDAEAHVSLSYMLRWEGDFAGAIAQCDVALRLSPNLATAHGAMGSNLTWSARRAEGRAALQHSIRLDPRSPALALRYLALAINYYLAGEYVAAIDELRRTVRLYPGYLSTYRYLAAALAQSGQAEEAGAVLKYAIDRAPGFIGMFARDRVAWHLPEDREHILDGLRKAGWEG
jgi:adenylate cyclase